jgi:hypothetical protein
MKHIKIALELKTLNDFVREKALAVAYDLIQIKVGIRQAQNHVKVVWHYHITHYVNTFFITEISKPLVDIFVALGDLKQRQPIETSEGAEVQGMT